MASDNQLEEVSLPSHERQSGPVRVMSPRFRSGISINDGPDLYFAKDEVVLGNPASDEKVVIEKRDLCQFLATLFFDTEAASEE